MAQFVCAFDALQDIESVKMRGKHSKKGNGEKMDPGWARLGKKIYQLEEYTSLVTPGEANA